MTASPESMPRLTPATDLISALGQVHPGINIVQAGCEPEDRPEILLQVLPVPPFFVWDRVLVFAPVSMEQ
jgi:hypothetical protein